MSQDGTALPEPGAGRGPGGTSLALARPGSRVVLAGAGEYPPGSPLPAVPAVRTSLTDLGAALRERVGVPPGNLRILPDTPNPLEFGRVLTRAASEATDTLVVHYVGHGLVGPDGALYLATGVTDSLVEGLAFTALPYAAVRQAVNGSRARTVVVVLDCCFSGRADTPAGPPALDAVFEQSLVRGGFLLTSTAREEHGLAVPGAAHTAFTGALIRLLTEGDPRGPRDLTLDHVFAYLSRTLHQDGAPRPRRHSSDLAGALVLARNPAYRARPVSRAAAEGPEDVTRDTDEAPCPYRGLESFGAEDARYFFGRSDLVAEVTERVAADGGMLAVVGASGCGKTSLLRAGVVPALEALPESRTVAAMTPGAHPVETFRGTVAALSRQDRGVLLVDQFEELFTAGAPEDERDRFVQALADLAAGPTAVVIAVRADFYEACARYAPLARALERRQVLVGPMGPEELRTVIEKPARLAGLRLEEGLTEALLRDARARRGPQPSAVLPLLSHALLATWQQRSGNLLTLAGYQATGGIDEAVARTAEAAYQAMDAADRPLVRGIMVRLVRLGEGVEDTRRRVAPADLADDGRRDAARRVLHRLATARLVTVDDEGCEIAHEALLHAWDRLRAWITEDRADLLAGQQLADAARAWDQAGRQDADLYRGPRLRTATAAVRNQPAVADALGPAARQFLDTSLRRERRRARNRLAGVAVVCVLALLAAVTGVTSVRAQHDAARKAAELQSTDLAADAAALSSGDPGSAAQLAVAAYRSAPTQDAVDQLYSSLGTPVERVVGSTGRTVLRVATQQNGSLAAAVDDDGTLRIWDLAKPTAPVLDATVHTAVEAIALAPRARLLAGPCPGADLCLWNLADPRRPVVAARLPLPAAARHSRLGTSSMAISPDGTVLASAWEQGSTMVWSIADPTRPRLLASLPNPTRQKGGDLAAVAFAHGGKLLAQTITDGSTTLWNIGDPSAPARVATIATGYQAVAFSPDGSLLAAAGDKNVGLWNVRDPAHPAPITVDNNNLFTDLRAVAFSPDGSRLAFSGTNSTSSQGTMCLLGLDAAELHSFMGALPTCTSTSFSTLAMAYSPNGALFTGGPDGVVRLWHSSPPRIDGVDASGRSWSLSPGGDQIAAAISPADGPSSSVGIWRTNATGDPVPQATLPVAAQTVSYLSTTTLMTVDAGTVQFWDLRHPRDPVRTASLQAAADPNTGGPQVGYSATADGGGALVSVMGGDGRLHLWHVTGSGHAVQVGSLPTPGSVAGSGVSPDGRTALLVTSAGITWWDISDPAHPVRGRTSTVAGGNKDSTAPGGSGGMSDALFAGDVFAAVTAPGGICGCATLDLWDVSAGHVRSASTPSTAVGTALGLSADGRLLAVSGPGGDSMTLWDTSDPGHPRTLSSLRTVKTLSSITLDTADHLMADVGAGNAVEVWDIRNPATPVRVADIALPDNPESVGFSGAPTLVVGDGQSILQYGTDPAAIADRLCSYTGSSLTTAQWRQDAPGVPYRKPCP